MSEEHQAFIKTPKQLITVVILAFVVPILIIVLLVKFVGAGARVGAGGSAMTPEAIEARIQPVARFELKGASGPKVLATGDAVYKAQCGACHDSGAAGAPKLGDAGAWAARIKTGYDALLTSALKGKGAMAPQGGGQFDDIEIGRAVVFMANKAGASFAEPKAPAGDAPAPAAESTPAAAPAAAPAAEAAPAAAPAAAAAPVAAAAPAGDAGKKLYETSCVACHASGVAGAPKFGDKAAWAPRIAAGMDSMMNTTLKGKGAMPPRGASTASDEELKAAVEYMVAAAK
jgi:cytochrome c5